MVDVHNVAQNSDLERLLDFDGGPWFGRINVDNTGMESSGAVVLPLGTFHEDAKTIGRFQGSHHSLVPAAICRLRKHLNHCAQHMTGIKEVSKNLLTDFNERWGQGGADTVKQNIIFIL